MTKEEAKIVCVPGSSNKVKIQYGLRDGKMVSVEDLAEHERGLKCGCTCSLCGGKLEARIGLIRAKHFAHRKNSDCPIDYARESELHYLAKEIIEEEKCLLFPPIRVAANQTPIFQTLSQEEQEKYKDNSLSFRGSDRLIHFDSVELEKRVGTIVPDIIAKCGDTEYIIEIAITHFIDGEKEEKIKKLGIPTLEVDLSLYEDEPITKEELKEILCRKSFHKRWIISNADDESIQEANKQFCKRIEAENKYDAEKQALVELLENPELYKEKILSLKNEEAFQKHYKSLNIRGGSPACPFYCNIPISGEFIFDCDRRIWQTALFYQFIYCCKNPCKEYDKIRSWAENYAPFKINEKCRQIVLANSCECNLVEDVLKTYLYYLHILGFISEKNTHPLARYDYEVFASYTIIPPNTRYADAFEKTLSLIDETDFWVDEEISNKMNELLGFRMSEE